MSRPLSSVFQGARYLLVRWQLLGLAAILAILGLGFLARAVDLWLADRLGPTGAAAATAGLLFLTALAVVGISAIVSACGRKAGPSPAKGLDAGEIGEMAVTLIDLGQKLSGEARSAAKPLAIAALVAGCAIGYSPALQKKLKDLLG